MSYLEELQGMSEDKRADAIESKIADACHLLVESDEFERAAGSTNATDWAVDEWDMVLVEIDEDECVVQITYSAAGEQMDDDFFSGDCISGEAQAVIDAAGNVSFREVTVEVSDSGDREDDEEDY